MPTVHVYGDEAGDFQFKLKASQYFIITTITMLDTAIEHELLQLKRTLAFDPDAKVREFFHATEDRQCVRDKVFDILSRYDFRIDSTILEKRKAQARITNDWRRFYKTAWYYHFKHVAPKILDDEDDLFVVAASIENAKPERVALQSAVHDVCSQVARCRDFAVECWPSASDPCLQIADYCCWAIQRKWVMGDERSYDLIKDKIASEFDIFRTGSIFYY